VNRSIALTVELRKRFFGKILILIKVKLNGKNYQKCDNDIEDGKRQILIGTAFNPLDQSSPAYDVYVETYKIERIGPYSKHI
jgi:hypothetical protein